MALYQTQTGMMFLMLHSLILLSFIKDFFSILLSTVESFIPDICWPRNKPWMTGQICKAVWKHDRVVSQSDSQVKKHWSWGKFVSYLSCCKQREIIEGVHSGWRNIKAGVSQGSVLGPLLFFIYINDLPVTISSCCVFLFADDRFLLEKVQSLSDCASNHDLTLKLISDWAKRWLVTMNESKTWQKETSL